LGWVIQESPSLLIMAFYLLRWIYTHIDSVRKLDLKPGEFMTIALALCWLVHYFNRALVFPLRMRGGAKPTTFTVVATAIAFCVTNTYLNAHALFEQELMIRSKRSIDGAFLCGVTLWLLGLLANWQSDAITRNLRRSPEDIKLQRYAIPYGGLYRYVSAPNYFAEFVEWTGFAVAAQTWAAFSFALWTFCNLYPRARSNHQWYLQSFANYGTLNRNAFFPNPFAQAPESQRRTVKRSLHRYREA
jgi:protein-S-isoprenylcysteine O-methyltransferase Ste14